MYAVFPISLTQCSFLSGMTLKVLFLLLTCSDYIVMMKSVYFPTLFVSLYLPKNEFNLKLWWC